VFPFLLRINAKSRSLPETQVGGMPFQADQIGGRRLISSTIRLNDGPVWPLKRRAPGDFLQIVQD
jgi:hypothetical protein